MMSMLLKAWESLQIDIKREFKSLFVTNSLDGSEDYLVSNKLFSLIGEEMKTFRKELMSSNSSRTLKEVVRNLIPPKGVVRKSNVEGSELMDGEGDEISVEGQQQEYEQVPDEEESDVIEAVEEESNVIESVEETSPSNNISSVPKRHASLSK